MSAGDVVTAVRGAVGLPAILATDACIHDGFVGFRSLSAKVLERYFYDYIAAIRGPSQSQAVGATFQNLNTAQIRAWQVPLPSLPLQTIFAEQVQRIEALARGLDAAAAKAEAVVAALSAEIFE